MKKVKFRPMSAQKYTREKYKGFTIKFSKNGYGTVIAEVVGRTFLTTGDSKKTAFNAMKKIIDSQVKTDREKILQELFDADLISREVVKEFMTIPGSKTKLGTLRELEDSGFIDDMIVKEFK